MKNNKHRGSSFDSFLEEEGILEKVNAAALQTIIAHRLKTKDIAKEKQTIKKKSKKQ